MNEKSNQSYKPKNAQDTKDNAFQRHPAEQSSTLNTNIYRDKYGDRRFLQRSTDNLSRDFNSLRFCWRNKNYNIGRPGTANSYDDKGYFNKSNGNHYMIKKKSFHKEKYGNTNYRLNNNSSGNLDIEHNYSSCNSSGQNSFYYNNFSRGARNKGNNSLKQYNNIGFNKLTIPANPEKEKMRPKVGISNQYSKIVTTLSPSTTGNVTALKLLSTHSSLSSLNNNSLSIDKPPSSENILPTASGDFSNLSTSPSLEENLNMRNGFDCQVSSEGTKSVDPRLKFKRHHLSAAIQVQSSTSPTLVKADLPEDNSNKYQLPSTETSIPNPGFASANTSAKMDLSKYSDVLSTSTMNTTNVISGEEAVLENVQGNEGNSFSIKDVHKDSLKPGNPTDSTTPKENLVEVPNTIAITDSGNPVLESRTPPPSSNNDDTLDLRTDLGPIQKRFRYDSALKNRATASGLFIERKKKVDPKVLDILKRKKDEELAKKIITIDDNENFSDEDDKDDKDDKDDVTTDGNIPSSVLESIIDYENKGIHGREKMIGTVERNQEVSKDQDKNIPTRIENEERNEDIPEYMKSYVTDDSGYIDFDSNLLEFQQRIEKIALSQADMLNVNNSENINVDTKQRDLNEKLFIESDGEDDTTKHHEKEDLCKSKDKIRYDSQLPVRKEDEEKHISIADFTFTNSFLCKPIPLDDSASESDTIVLKLQKDNLLKVNENERLKEARQAVLLLLKNKRDINLKKPSLGYSAHSFKGNTIDNNNPTDQYYEKKSEIERLWPEDESDNLEMNNNVSLLNFSNSNEEMISKSNENDILIPMCKSKLVTARENDDNDTPNSKTNESSVSKLISHDTNFELSSKKIADYDQLDTEDQIITHKRHKRYIVYDDDEDRNGDDNGDHNGDPYSNKQVNKKLKASEKLEVVKQSKPFERLKAIKQVKHSEKLVDSREVKNLGKVMPSSHEETQVCITVEDEANSDSDFEFLGEVPVNTTSNLKKVDNS